jgi:5-methylcytosine-specific restriction endonuclease McrA
MTTRHRERRMTVAHTLLLNATYEPIHLVTARRAVLLVLRQKAEVVEESGEVIRSEKRTIPIPSVIRLVSMVRIPYRTTVKLTRKGLAARDHGLCGYCGKPGETTDHIVPRSRGGKTEWTNVVWACKPCNGRKADKLLSEVKMALHTKAYAPKGRAWIVVAVGTVDPRWEPYLGMAGSVA